VKKKKHFQEIGRKRFKKRKQQQFSKVISVRLTEKEFENRKTSLKIY
jgi:hypothetical protein